MMSAGESDIETDRVSYLHTTALGFAPFIFDLCENDGFSELMKICEGVWEEIKENNSLPDKLVKCNFKLFSVTVTSIYWLIFFDETPDPSTS